jgi:heme A synthase
MTTLRRLSLAAVAIALGTVMLGSWTRINGAGMTCPDWPLCHGMLIPSLADGTVWEWTHRLLAFLVAPAVLAVIAAAWPQRKQPFIAPALGAIVLLFLTQVGLGAATVHLSNSPFSVVLHWGTAMAFIGTLCAMAVVATPAQAPGNAREAAVTGMLAGTAFVTFVTMCVGAYVSSSGAGLACLSLPGCAGNVVVYNDGQFVQMLHRAIAAGTLLCAVCAFALVWVRPASARVRAAASIGLGLVFVQVLLGLLNVALRLPMDLREAHAVNAALVFLAFTVAMLFSMTERAAFGESAAA